MATSEVKICNRALAAVGSRSTIASLTENSAEAKDCNMIYEDTRDQILGMANWNFAKKTAYLSLLKSAPGTPSNPDGATTWSADYPAPPWLYEYSYPEDCVAVRFIVPQLDTAYAGVPIMTNVQTVYPYGNGPVAMFQIATDEDSNGNQQNVILTNQYQAIACYTKRITDPNLWGALYTQALVYALAAKLAVPRTGSTKIMGAMFQLANDAILQARASDGNEGLTIIDNVPDWIAVRDDLGPSISAGYWTAPYAPLFGAFG